MATTTLKGIVKEILPVEYYGDGNKGRKQTVVLFVPGYTNGYGEKTGRDEVWGIDVFNAKIEEHGLNDNCLSKKADVEVYLGSREFDKQDGSGKWYAISATLKSIKLGDTIRTSQNTDTDGAGDDDLPF